MLVSDTAVLAHGIARGVALPTGGGEAEEDCVALGVVRQLAARYSWLSGTLIFICTPSLAAPLLLLRLVRVDGEHRVLALLLRLVRVRD